MLSETGMSTPGAQREGAAFENHAVGYLLASFRSDGSHGQDAFRGGGWLRRDNNLRRGQAVALVADGGDQKHAAAAWHAFVVLVRESFHG